MSKNLSPVSFVLKLVSSSIKGLIVSILLVLGLAFLLKFVEIPDKFITIFDQLIKIISIFVAVKSFLKFSPNKSLLKSFVVGAVYTLLTFILFSSLAGSYQINLNLILDLLFGGVVGIIFAVILNLFSKEKLIIQD